MSTKSQTLRRLFEEPQVIAKLYFKDETRQPFICTPYQEHFLKHAFPKQHPYMQFTAATQSGKSEAISIGICLLLIFYPNEKVAVVSYTDDQAGIIFGRSKDHMVRDNKEISDMVDHSEEFTKKSISLLNGSKLRCFTAAESSEGESLLGFNASTLVLDESGSISDLVYYQKIMRMVAAARVVRTVWELGTPHRKNHFYKSWKNPKYFKIHVSWRDAVAAGQMREDHVLMMKENMTPIEFMMWYEAEFPEETEDALIKGKDIESAIERWEVFDGEYDLEGDKAKILGEEALFLGGCDVARYGVDETVRGTLEWEEETRQYLVRAINNTSKKPITDTAGRIQLDEEEWKYHLYTVDDTGVGGGVTDILKTSPMAPCVVPFIAGGKPLHSKRYLNIKAEAYFFLARLFTKELIAIPNHPKLVAQLQGMRYEVQLDKRLKVLDPGEKATHEKGVRSKSKSPDYSDMLMMAVYPTFFGEVVTHEPDIRNFDDLIPKPKARKKRWPSYGY